MEGTWNPWKITAIGMALVMVTALVTGLVVANWTGPEPQQTNAAPAGSSTAPTPAPLRATAKHAPVRTAQAAPAPQAVHTAQAGVPSAAVVEACNRQAAAQGETRDKTMEVVKDAAIGAVVGAAVGAAGGAIAGGGKGAGKGAAIGGVVGAGGGTLYGLNENKKHDEQYRAAYSHCMQTRGYAG